jgi:hypothetical protein
MPRVVAAIAAVTALVLTVPRTVAAQMYFGQNHVQYDQFKWEVIETEHFQVHYYPEISAVARMVDGWRMHFERVGVGARDIESLSASIDRHFLADQRKWAVRLGG